MERADNIYTDEELHTIQQKELYILSKIVEICEAKSIEYFLVGGTCLGAIRHNGFIPWDDDIDIGMTRENYNKFLQAAPEVLPSEMILQTPSLKDKICPYFYTKVRLNGTKFVEYCNRNLPMPQGIYVDIFPFDEVPDDEKEAKKQWEHAQKLVKRFVYRQSPDISQKPTTLKLKFKSILRRTIHSLYRLFIPYNKLYGQLCETFECYNGTGQNTVACLNFSKFKADYLLKKDLKPLQTHNFEGKKYYVPNNCDTYLKTHYGDYMQLPPVEERFGHKPFLIEL